MAPNFCSSIRNIIIGGSEFGKTNPLFNLITQQTDIEKNYLYAKESHEAKYRFLINKREITDWKHLNGLKAFIEYSNDMDRIYKNIEEYNPNKKRKTWILFWRYGCFYIYLVFITKSYFAVPRNIRLNSSHHFITKVPNKLEFEQIAFIHSSDIGFRGFLGIQRNFYKKCIENHILS